MSKTGRTNHRRGQRGHPKAERHIRIHGVRRDPPDLRKLSRAVIAIALREAELDAEAKAAAEEVNTSSVGGAATTPTTEEAAYD